MKRIILATALAALAGGGNALAQSSPPPLPKLDAQQSADVGQQLSLYRTEIEGRVARGEITAAEADRLIAWRHWQLAQSAAGLAPPGDVPPGPIADAPPRPVQQYYYSPPPVYYAAPPVYYAPPAYYAPYPYYWGPRVCAGGFGRHFGGRFCF
jgi:hypothetical protein